MTEGHVKQATIQRHYTNEEAAKQRSGRDKRRDRDDAGQSGSTQGRRKDTRRNAIAQHYAESSPMIARRSKFKEFFHHTV